MGSIIQPASFGAGSPTNNLILDDYPDAGFAFALRKLRTDYAGYAALFRDRTNDDEEAFGFVGEDFDNASLVSWLGGHTASIVSWFDQSENGFDLSEATALSQPGYNAAGVGGKPAIEFGGTRLSRAGVDMSNVISTQGTVFLVLGPGSSGVRVWFSWGAGGHDFQGANLNGDYSFDLGDDTGNGRVVGATPGGTGFAGEEVIVEMYRDSSDEEGIVANGSSLVAATRTQDITSNGAAALFVGVYLDGSFGSYLGYMSEFICWPTDLGSTNRANARTNINNYYTVF